MMHLASHFCVGLGDLIWLNDGCSFTVYISSLDGTPTTPLSFHGYNEPFYSPVLLPESLPTAIAAIAIANEALTTSNYPTINGNSTILIVHGGLSPCISLWNISSSDA